jgi:hypothetical protein
MAYDEQLDSRISGIVTPWGATRRAMFGGTAYMLSGNLMAGVYKDRLLVRLSAAEGAAALEEPHVTPFDMMHHPMPGWVTISSEGVVEAGLLSWLERGRKHAESLPPK